MNIIRTNCSFVWAFESMFQLSHVKGEEKSCSVRCHQSKSAGAFAIGVLWKPEDSFLKIGFWPRCDPGLMWSMWELCYCTSSARLQKHHLPFFSFSQWSAYTNVGDTQSPALSMSSQNSEECQALYSCFYVKYVLSFSTVLDDTLTIISNLGRGRHLGFSNVLRTVSTTNDPNTVMNWPMSQIAAINSSWQVQKVDQST